MPYKDVKKYKKPSSKKKESMDYRGSSESKNDKSKDSTPPLTQQQIIGRQQRAKRQAEKAARKSQHGTPHMDDQGGPSEETGKSEQSRGGAIERTEPQDSGTYVDETGTERGSTAGTSAADTSYTTRTWY